ncbi:hypothetical protein JCM16303_002158 [Sporobolomyces ruberrimus]
MESRSEGVPLQAKVLAAAFHLYKKSSTGKSSRIDLVFHLVRERHGPNADTELEDPDLKKAKKALIDAKHLSWVSGPNNLVADKAVRGIDSWREKSTLDPEDEEQAAARFLAQGPKPSLIVASTSARPTIVVKPVKKSLASTAAYSPRTRSMNKQADSEKEASHEEEDQNEDEAEVNVESENEDQDDEEEEENGYEGKGKKRASKSAGGRPSKKTKVVANKPLGTKEEKGKASGEEGDVVASNAEQQPEKKKKKSSRKPGPAGFGVNNLKKTELVKLVRELEERIVKAESRITEVGKDEGAEKSDNEELSDLEDSDTEDQAQSNQARDKVLLEQRPEHGSSSLGGPPQGQQARLLSAPPQPPRQETHPAGSRNPLSLPPLPLPGPLPLPLPQASTSTSTAFDFQPGGVPSTSSRIVKPVLEDAVAHRDFAEGGKFDKTNTEHRQSNQENLQDGEARKPDDQPQLEKEDDTSQSPFVPEVHSPTHDDQAGELDAGDQTLVDVEVEAQDKGPLQALLGFKSIGGDNLLNREASYKGQRRDPTALDLKARDSRNAAVDPLVLALKEELVQAKEDFEKLDSIRSELAKERDAATGEKADLRRLLKAAKEQVEVLKVGAEERNRELEDLTQKAHADQQTITALTQDVSDSATERESLVRKAELREAQDESGTSDSAETRAQLEETKQLLEQAVTAKAKSDARQEALALSISHLENQLRIAREDFSRAEEQKKNQVEEISKECRTKGEEFQAAKSAYNSLHLDVINLAISCSVRVENNASPSSLINDLKTAHYSLVHDLHRRTTAETSAFQLARSLLQVLSPRDVAHPSSTLEDLLKTVTCRVSDVIRQAHQATQLSDEKGLVKAIAELVVAGGGGEVPTFFAQVPKALSDIKNALVEKNTVILNHESKIGALETSLHEAYLSHKTLESSVGLLQGELATTTRRLDHA